MQEDIEQRTVSITVQASKLTGRVLKAAIAAALQKMEQERNTPKVGRNSMKRLTARDPGANTIEVTGRIRSFERIAKKHEVRYHIEKAPGTDPPKWTVYFKADSKLLPVALAVTNRAGAMGGVIRPRVTFSTAITPICM